MSDSTTQDSRMSDYVDATPTSEQALHRARRHLPMGLTRSTLAFRPHPFFVARGEGAYVLDLDGNRYLDLVNNYTSLIHGHTHEATRAAVIRAMEESPAPGAPTQLEELVARDLATRIPNLELMRFSTTGSEAVLCALRAARAFTGRSRILKFEGGFHGSIDDVQVSIGQTPMGAGTYGPGTPATGGINDAGTIIAIYNDINSVTDALAAHGEEVAAVIAEPFLGNAGLVDAAPGFLRAVAELAAAHGAVFILDEIQSCRVAFGGAQSLHGVTPDLTTVGKTIGGGLPLAAAGGRRDIMAVYDGFEPVVNQTGTFNGFPLSLAAALATLENWREAHVDRLNEAGDRVRTGLRRVLRQHSVPAVVNGRGSMFHVAFSSVPVDRYAAHVGASRDMGLALHRELLLRGVSIMPRGTGCLSTAMSDSDVDHLLEMFDQAVGAVARERIAA